MDKEKFLSYFHTEKPAAGEMPYYYLKAIRYSYLLMAMYFCCYMICAFFLNYLGNCAVVIPWLLISAALAWLHKYIPQRWSIVCLCTLLISWVITFIYCYGWDCGVQHFIIPLRVILMFSVYASPIQKLSSAAALFGLRLVLFFYCLNNEPVYQLQYPGSAFFQTINTAFIFAYVAVLCLVFSTNIQKSEKMLLINNQMLKKQANTDALTGLYNRRHMIEMIERQIATHPREIFSVALGDIDLFKEVNDTYGHNCGDAVLKYLANLFQERLGNGDVVCRWGGEEFFFFFPGKNLDEASVFIHDLNFAVSKQIISYKDTRCHVTMTFGLEEYDFQSSLTDMIKRADDKLYYGKNHGRNKVIF